MNQRTVNTAATGYKTHSTRSIMLRVLFALLPGVTFYAWFISPLIVFNIAFAIVAALVLEATAVRLRRGKLMATLGDGSITLAAALLAISVPPTLPFWQLFIGILIMVMLGKHVYGGLGNNPFNPAMVGYAALMVSFPQTMTLWASATELAQIPVAELLSTKLNHSPLNASRDIAWDAITQATPLEYLRTQRLQNEVPVQTDLIQYTLNSQWIWVNTGFLLGGLYLLWARIIRWHIPVGVLATLAILQFVFANNGLPTHFALLSGAAIVGAFFIATDPVTTASSNRGKLLFGIGVGALTFTIREYGGYPDGFAFAILLMNLSVPLIDHLELTWAGRKA